MRKAGTFTAEVEKTYSERLKTEIDVINTMGFPGYFLIVADFINWAKDREFPSAPAAVPGPAVWPPTACGSPISIPSPTA